ncbi:MAG: Glu/Leu/Phe/Val dehydrogenase [Sedimentisphaerales bacterium]|nr:Glu/Leu/Phe/Val dehydrogenase [Sedimentisphaerales bacterium]
MSRETDSILQTALHNFEQAAKRLKLENSVYQKVLGPKEKIEININPVLPDGKVTHIKVFIVRHNDALGPAKGGIRMTPDVTFDDVTGLAMEMTWKTSLIGVPFGGGKSGIQSDPARLRPDEKEIIVRAFIRGARRHIGPEIYIPAPDMGTNQTDMAHIRDCISYSEGTSITKGCYVTGKPVILGGIVGRREATGKGVVYTILSACEKLGLDIKNMRIALQGFGNVGSVAAVELAKYGVKIIAIADISGMVVNEKGLDIEALLQHSQQSGYVKGFNKATEVDRDKIFAIDCDILIPAASGSQITIDNVRDINAKIIAEGANAPTTAGADEVLNKQGIFVIPDILCNAGGVFVSYLEYTQETQREQMGLAQVEHRLAERMKQRFNEVYDFSKERSLTMREAAMDIAVSKIVEATFARGLLP